MEDGNLLSTEQVLLLENLTYLLDNKDLDSLKTIVKRAQSEGKETITVNDIVNQLLVKEIDDNKDYGSFMTGKDWKNILQAIKNDATLCGMTVVEVHGDPAKSKEEADKETRDWLDFGNEEDDYDGAISALFVNDNTGEAVVAFRGTVGYEWDDNFYAGTVTDANDGVSTEYQAKALEWYRSLNLEEAGYETITVTGHSKGGNKAKYITIMDASVDRCLSFDGQGFSDEFIYVHNDKIARYQDKITNHNVEYDFVNLLLNDVGELFFYRGFDYGEGSLLEAHCPNTFFTFDEVGNANMTPVSERAEEMKVLDEFLNSYLHILSPQKKEKTLKVLGELLEVMTENKSPLKYIEILEMQGGAEVLEDLFDYSKFYAFCNPELAESIQDILLEFLVYPEVQIKEPQLVEKARHLLNKIMTIYSGQKLVSVIYDSVSGDIDKDLKVAPINCPLERNRVFDINKMKQFGIVGKQLLDTGSMACKEWDKAVEGLHELESLVPTEVKSAVLTNSLAEIPGPFARTDYEVMGDIIYNNINRLVQEVTEQDNNGAKALDEITEKLAANITIIKGLEESTRVHYEGILG